MKCKSGEPLALATGLVKHPNTSCLKFDSVVPKNNAHRVPNCLNRNRPVTSESGLGGNYA